MQGRQRLRSGARLSWYGDTPDDEFWFRHWERKLSPDWLATSEGRDPDTDGVLSAILRWLPLEGRHLEAGCGSGDYVVALGVRGYDIEGIELSAKLVALVNQRFPSVPVSVGNALDIDCPDDHYQGYVSIGVVEHRESGPEPFLAEAARVLAPGGTLVLAVPGFGAIRKVAHRWRPGPEPAPGEPFFQYAFGPDELSQLVRDAGFEVRETHFVGAYRMLLEEVPGFRWVTNQRGGKYVRRAAEQLLGNRDGHMLVLHGVRT